jgi:hypothetical protein
VAGDVPDDCPRILIALLRRSQIIRIVAPRPTARPDGNPKKKLERPLAVTKMPSVAASSLNQCRLSNNEDIAF